MPLQAIVVPIPGHSDLARLFSEQLALLIVMDPQLPHLAREAYQSLFGLTNAEAALLFALVNGHSLAEWAAARGSSMATVKTQLNALFAKTGVDSQPKLLRIAKTLPAVE